MTTDDIIAAARRAVGTPFRHQGRTPGVALDCAGLALYVAAENGVDTIDHEGYPR
jgi:cell wall-associated NlpC family hydrolase